ncbi:MAG TPA: DUF1232 domain-containing protein [Gaiellaceae bacterium]|nr:DUF1232 domain-containing protein [Gaiellaceae bacterium]
MITSILIGSGIAMLVAWSALAAVVFVARPPGQSVAELARVLPHSLRLAFALYRDRTLPSSVRWRLRIALLHNIQPINLIPDVIPVIGFADNVAVLVWALRSTVRTAGPETVSRHWSGSPASLTALYRALHLPTTPPTA